MFLIGKHYGIKEMFFVFAMLIIDVFSGNIWYSPTTNKEAATLKKTQKFSCCKFSCECQPCCRVSRPSTSTITLRWWNYWCVVSDSLSLQVNGCNPKSWRASAKHAGLFRFQGPFLEALIAGSWNHIMAGALSLPLVTFNSMMNLKNTHAHKLITTHQAPLVWCHCCLQGWWPSSSTLAYASIEAPSPHDGSRCRWMQCQWTQQKGTCTVRAVSGEETCIHVEIQFYHSGELHLSSLCLQVNGRSGNIPQCITQSENSCSSIPAQR